MATTPKDSALSGRVLFGIFAAFILALVVWAGFRIADRTEYEDVCAERGGVAVKSHLGPIVCIDRNALIEVGE